MKASIDIVCLLCETKQRGQGDAMNINSINLSAHHPKLIIEQFRSQNDLPFQDVLSAEAIEKHIGTIEHRSRIFTPDVTLFAFLSQVIGSDQSCQAAVAQVIASFAKKAKEISANTAAYCKARLRLPKEVLSGLAKESAEQLEEEAPKEWLWKGRHVKLVDGSCLSMPDTAENQAVYPQPDTQKKGLDFH